MYWSCGACAVHQLIVSEERDLEVHRLCRDIWVRSARSAKYMTGPKDRQGQCQKNALKELKKVGISANAPKVSEIFRD